MYQRTLFLRYKLLNPSFVNQGSLVLCLGLNLETKTQKISIKFKLEFHVNVYFSNPTFRKKKIPEHVLHMKLK